MTLEHDLTTVDEPATGAVTVLTAATFDEFVAGADLPVLVDFTATWCPPCRQLSPVLHQLASDLRGRLSIAEVDVDDHPGLAVRFGVRGAPTMVLLVDGEVAAVLVGARGRDRLLADLEPHVRLD